MTTTTRTRLRLAALLAWPKHLKSFQTSGTKEATTVGRKHQRESRVSQVLTCVAWYMYCFLAKACSGIPCSSLTRFQHCEVADRAKALFSLSEPFQELEVNCYVRCAPRLTRIELCCQSRWFSSEHHDVTNWQIFCFYSGWMWRALSGKWTCHCGLLAEWICIGLWCSHPWKHNDLLVRQWIQVILSFWFSIFYLRKKTLSHVVEPDSLNYLNWGLRCCSFTAPCLLFVDCFFSFNSDETNSRSFSCNETITYAPVTRKAAWVGDSLDEHCQRELMFSSLLCKSQFINLI